MWCGILGRRQRNAKTTVIRVIRGTGVIRGLDHLNVAPLFGIGSESPVAKIFFNFGYEF
jgi:hypothetical protein